MSLDQTTTNTTAMSSNADNYFGEMGTFAIVMPWQLEAEGGVNQVVINLYKEIARTGPYRPIFFVADWEHPRPREGEGLGYRTVSVRIRSPYKASSPVLSLCKYALSLPVSLSRLWRLLARYDVQVVNGHFPSLAMLNVVLLSYLRLYRGKFLLSFHGRDIRSVLVTRGLERILWRWLLRRTDAIVFCSDGLAESLRSFDPKLRSQTVRNGVSFRDLVAEKSSMGTLPKGPFILNIGAFEHKKGQDVLIRAFGRLAAEFPELRLLLLGQAGPVYDELRSLVTALGLEQHVQFAVDVPHAEILGYIEAATVFALPSRAEGLPIALLEAGVFGVPVVASNVDGIPEVINSEDVGVLVDADDEYNLELALRKLLIDPDLRRSLGMRLLTRINDEFTWGRAWREYLALIPAGRRHQNRNFQ